MNEKINRRRIIKISAAASVCLLTSATLPNAMAASENNKLYRWHGRALGADAEMLLNIPNHMEGDLLLSKIII